MRIDEVIDAPTSKVDPNQTFEPLDLLADFKKKVAEFKTHISAIEQSKTFKPIEQGRAFTPVEQSRMFRPSALRFSPYPNGRRGGISLPPPPPDLPAGVPAVPLDLARSTAFVPVVDVQGLTDQMRETNLKSYGPMRSSRTSFRKYP